MDINSNDRDDLDTKLFVEWMSDTLNQLINTLLDQDEVVFHCILATTVHVIELTNSLLSPDDLGGKKRDLSIVVLKPDVSGLVDITEVPTVSSDLRGFKNFSQSCLHASLKITKVVLDSTTAGECFMEWNVLLLIGEHTIG